MTKRELISEIMEINQTAGPDFLADFADNELDDYLEHLRESRKPRPLQFANAPTFNSSAAPKTLQLHSNDRLSTAEPTRARAMDSTNTPPATVTLAVTTTPAPQPTIGRQKTLSIPFNLSARAQPISEKSGQTLLF